MPAALTNGRGGTALAMEIVRAIAREYSWPDYAPKERALAAVDPKALEAYASTYEFRPTPTVTVKIEVTREQGRLYTLQAGIPKEEWLPFSETEFFRTASETTLQFVKDAQGRVAELVVTQDGDAYHGQKIQLTP